MRTTTFLLTLLFFSVSIGAFNHPELQWKTVSTSHFEINFYDKTEESVYAVWKIAEEVYTSLAKLYDYQPVEKIALSIAEYDDFSNGFAEPNAGNVVLWLPDSRFELRSTTTWLRNVVTHELTHIFSLEQKRTHQLIAIRANLAVSSPNEMYGVSEPFIRFSEYPTWLVEGITQFETEQAGNDCFDTRREMVLRTAVLSHTELSLDEMGNFNHDLIGNEKVYNQGFALTRFIAGKIGTDKLRDIFCNATAKRVNLYDELEYATGTSAANFYSAWIDSLRNYYSSQFSSVIPNHTIQWSHGNTNVLPKISPDGMHTAWISSGNADAGRTDLLVAPADNLQRYRRINHAHTAFCFSKESDRVYYVKSRNPNRTGSYLNDLFSFDLVSGKERRITRNGRVYDVCAIPGSDDLLCICYGSNVFGLYRCTITTGTLTKIIPGEAGMPLVIVAVDAGNSNHVVVSKVINGQSRLFRATMTGDSLAPLSPGNGQEESPCFAPDGRIYYSADYDGIFNIYSLFPDGSDLQKHTSTSGGYFSPFVATNGTMAASHYQPSGFAIVTVQPAAQPFTHAQKDRCAFRSLPVAEGNVIIKSRPYQGKFRRSLWELGVSGELSRNNNLLLAPIRTIDTAQMQFSVHCMRYASDALHKTNLLVGAAIGGLQETANRTPSRPFLHRAIQQFMREPLSLQHATARYSSTSPFSHEYNFISMNHRLLRRAQSGSTDTTSRQENPSLRAIIQPFMQYESSRLAPTWGMQTAMVLINDLVYNIQLSPYAEYQIANDWFLSSRLGFRIYPNYPIVTSELPLSLTYSNIGYQNEDIAYNYGDASQVSVTFSPTITIEAMLQDSDTLPATVSGFSSQLFLFHAIPVKKYSSIQLLSSSGIHRYAKPILDMVLLPTDNSKLEILEGESDSYMYSGNSCTFVFPINRSINKGTRHYFDALYGSIGYSLIAYANSTALENIANIGSRAFFDPDYMKGSLYLDHIISLSCKLGRYKSYLDFGTIDLACSFQLLRRAMSLSLTSGF